MIQILHLHLHLACSLPMTCYMPNPHQECVRWVSATVFVMSVIWVGLRQLRKIWNKTRIKKKNKKKQKKLSQKWKSVGAKGKRQNNTYTTVVCVCVHKGRLRKSPSPKSINKQQRNNGKKIWRERNIQERSIVIPPPLSGVPRLEKKQRIRMNERAPPPSPHSLFSPAVWRKGEKMYRRCLHRSSGSSSRTGAPFIRRLRPGKPRNKTPKKTKMTENKRQITTFFFLFLFFFHQWKWRTPTRRANLSAPREKNVTNSAS